MPGRDVLLSSMLNEVELAKFLATKIPDGGLDYRPTPGQRSTLELLRYLTICGHRIAEIVLTENWDLREQYEKESEQVQSVADFTAAMNRQADRLRALFDGLSDDEFATREVKVPWGGTTTVEGLLLNASLRFLVGYRMQLFLYLKGMGRSELGTYECWLGQDPPPPEE